MSAQVEAFIAVTRFGLGAGPGDLAALRGNPRDGLAAQLDARYVRSAALDALPSTAEALSRLRAGREMKQQARQDARDPAMTDGAGRQKLAAARKEAAQETNGEYISQVAALTRAAVASPAPFLERLVQFWRNHFTVSVTKRQDMALVAAFERDAIRPHVLGNFHNMLRASTRHPAMQVYLDNFRSVGAASPAGRRTRKGLNENLAREILELHTLGVDGGYTQGDVTQFARVLTGWTIDVDGRGDGSGFFFAPLRHDPGPKRLLGRTYDGGGVEEGEQVLAALAWHPSTARFIATKLARHFIADDPPAAAVARLEAAFTQNDGALVPVYKTLLSLTEAWQAPLAKVKTPNDLVLSMLRASGIAEGIEDRKLVGLYRMLNQMPFAAPSPAGWSDRAADWMSAEALLRRIDLARFAAREMAAQAEPSALLEAAIGPVASVETRNAVARAGSKQEAIALLFSSPEFQRR